MRIVSAVQRKGGAGKTVLLQALASAIAEQGGKVALFDADRDEQLALWQNHFDTADWQGVSKPAWNEKVQYFPGKSIKDIFAKLAEIEDQGFTVALIDTGGGTDQETENIILNCDAIAVPVKTDVNDLDLLNRTMDWLLELADRQDDGSFPFAATVLVNVPTDSQQRASDKAMIEIIKEMPHFETSLPNMAALKDINRLGPLGTAAAAYAASGRPAKHIRDALTKATALWNEFEEEFSDE